MDITIKNGRIVEKVDEKKAAEVAKAGEKEPEVVETVEAEAADACRWRATRRCAP